MDTSRLSSGDNALKQSAPKFVDLISDDEGDVKPPQATEGHTDDPVRVDEASAEEYEDGEDGDAEDVWAVSSFIEDAIETLAEQEFGDASRPSLLLFIQFLD